MKVVASAKSINPQKLPSMANAACYVLQFVCASASYSLEGIYYNVILFIKGRKPDNLQINNSQHQSTKLHLFDANACFLYIANPCGTCGNAYIYSCSRRGCVMTYAWYLLGSKLSNKFHSHLAMTILYFKCNKCSKHKAGYFAGLNICDIKNYTKQKHH